MSSTSLADQLEDAIAIMIAEPKAAPPKADLAIGELLKVAADLRLLPDPRFKSALMAELLPDEPSAAISVAARAWATSRQDRSRKFVRVKFSRHCLVRAMARTRFIAEIL